VIPRVAAALLVASCTQAPRPDPLAEIGDPAATGDPVVARVNGRSILASEVLARRRVRDGGPALEDLVLEDLLAAEARRQGLLADPQVRQAARRAMVQRLLEEEFEKKVRPEDIPDSVLRQAYRKNYWFFNRPEVRHFDHALVWAAPTDPPGKQESARRLAEEILAQAARTGAPLADLAREYGPRGKARGLEVRFESTRGVRLRLEKDFGDVLWAAASGELGGRVARSRYGYHALRLLRVETALSRPFEEVREEVRQRVWPEVRQQRFGEWMTALRARHGAEIAEAARLLSRTGSGGPVR
jgi:peptidyl-prolyl cis-trans isomerase C